MQKRLHSTSASESTASKTFVSTFLKMILIVSTVMLTVVLLRGLIFGGTAPIKHERCSYAWDGHFRCVSTAPPPSVMIDVWNFLFRDTPGWPVYFFIIGWLSATVYVVRATVIQTVIRWSLEGTTKRWVLDWLIQYLASQPLSDEDHVAWSETFLSYGRDFFSDFLAKSIRHYDFRPIRQKARRWTAPQETRPTKDGNPHATSAGDRAAAEDDIERFANELGKKIWVESGSSKDWMRGHAGRRQYYSARDLTVERRDDELEDHHVVKLTDTDFYMSQEQFGDLVANGNTVAMYTILPRHLWLGGELSASFQDSVYRQDGRGAGSHIYEHPLWFWETDNLMLQGSDGTYTYCYVETCLMPRNRGLVFLIPAYSIPYSSWKLMGDTGLELTRINTRPFPGLDLDVLSVNEKYLISAPGWSCEIECSPKQFADAKAAAALNPKTLSLGTLIRTLDLPTDSLPYSLKQILLGETAAPVSMPSVRDGTRVYTPQFRDVEVDQHRFRGGNYMKPLIDGAFTPSDSLASDISCVNERVIKIKPICQKYPVKYFKYIQEFVRQVRGGVKPLVPYTEDEVLSDVPARLLKKYYASYDSPCDLEDLKYKSFQKSEAYSEVKAPRNISCVPTEHVAAYSRYTKLVCAFMQEYGVKWYAFAKGPEELANRVVEVARKSGVLLTTDFSKYDGTQSVFARDVERELLLELFDTRFHAEIRSLTDGEVHCIFRTTFRVVYNNEYTKLSGGAATSLGNTVVNGCTNYISLRECGLSADKAWDQLGLYGGDDGLVSHPDPHSLSKVVACLQMKIKPRIIGVSEPVDFLGRLWPSPRTDAGSFFDPMRCLSKLHFTASTQDTDNPSRALFRKCISLYATDSGSFIGDIAAHFLRGFARAGRAPLAERVPWMKGIFDDNELLCAEDVIKKFSVNPVFPQAPPGAAYTYFVQQTGLDDAVVEEWLSNVLSGNPLEDDLCLMKVDAKPEIAVEVDGQLMGPTMAPKPEIPVTPKPNCFEYLHGRCNRGDNCKYVHLKNFCRNFVNGKCTHEKCKFKHYTGEISRPVGAGRRTKKENKESRR